MRVARLLMLMLLCAAVLGARGASMADPESSFTHYKHGNWTIEDGAPALILALAQGRDGYLWMGGRDGLFRFDGIAFERIGPARAPGDHSVVSSVMAARDGTIWVGYSAGGVERYRGGVLRDAGLPNRTAYVMSLVQSADGAVWAELGSAYPQLARFTNGRWEEIGENWGLPREPPINILAARDGTLWLTTISSLYKLRPGSRRFERIPVSLSGHGALSEDHSGQIWLTDDSGARAVTGSATTRFPYPTPPAPRSVRTFFDQDGNLWGMTGNAGIFRVSAPDSAGEVSAAAAAARVDVFRQQDSLTSDNSFSMFEDREGNIWVGTSLGLDRFRPADVIVEPLLTHIPPWGDVLLGASDGNVYVGESDTVYRILPEGRPEPILTGVGDPETICEGSDGAVWTATSRRLIRYADGRSTDFTRPPTREALMDCAVDRHGTLWVSGVEGLFRQTQNGWQLHAFPDGEEERSAMPMVAARDGRLVVYSTPRSLSRIDYPLRSDLVFSRPDPLRDLRTIHQGSNALLLGGRFGLARLRDRRVHFLNPERVPAFTSVTGIVQTPEGETWTIGGRGVARVSTAALDRTFDDPRMPLAPQLFDFRDGLPAFNMRDGKRDVVRGGDGRLWFATTAGTVWVDPSRLERNTLPPPVNIASLRANGTSHRDPTRLTLPSGTSAIEITYAALSLSIPERVKVRYRLEGADEDWVEPGMRRQAFYTNLGPGTYRFRVIAANNDGVWNRDGATLEFTIPPTFLQSNWFVLLCMIGLGLLLWLIYSMRVRRITARARAGLEARLAERERIARELHDTLLQSFQGLVLRFQAVADQIPRDQPLRPVIDEALDRADAALIEGRDRVRDLRAVEGDLAQALIDVAEDRAAGSETGFNLTIEGHPRPLHPMVREEVQQIGAEAIRNAFLHARAREIEAALTYGSNELRFDLRDDGIGIPAEFTTGGARPGHYGLMGMRERAVRIGGTLTISSGEQAGTEVRLSIPGRAAYVAQRQGWLDRFLARWRKG